MTPNIELQIELQPATSEDLPLLYSITQIAMHFVNQKSNPNQIFSEEQRQDHYKKYVVEFTPQLNNTSIITLDGQKVGRLRVVRDADCIFVGGIQILPDYQSQGIGSRVMDDLIQESRRDNKLLQLMVHKNNPRALVFYEQKGFQKIEETPTQYKMQLDV